MPWESSGPTRASAPGESLRRGSVTGPLTALLTVLETALGGVVPGVVARGRAEGSRRAAAVARGRSGADGRVADAAAAAGAATRERIPSCVITAARSRYACGPAHAERNRTAGPVRGAASRSGRFRERERVPRARPPALLPRAGVRRRRGRVRARGGGEEEREHGPGHHGEGGCSAPSATSSAGARDHAKEPTAAPPDGRVPGVSPRACPRAASCPRPHLGASRAYPTPATAYSAAMSTSAGREYPSGGSTSTANTAAVTNAAL